ncbi:MAG: polymer-forming cytoskeletal protein [Pseudomonadota bacterium]
MSHIRTPGSPREATLRPNGSGNDNASQSPVLRPLGQDGDTPPPTPDSPPAAGTSQFGPGRRPDGQQTSSVIDAWLVIRGDLESDGEVRVDGKVFGDITCAQLTIGEKAIVTGNVAAQNVIVRGKLSGTIRAHMVSLMAGADVESDVFYKLLSIDQGSHFEGHSKALPDPLSADADTLVEDLRTKAAAMRASLSGEADDEAARTLAG